MAKPKKRVPAPNDARVALCIRLGISPRHLQDPVFAEKVETYFETVRKIIDEPLPEVELHNPPGAVSSCRVGNRICTTKVIHDAGGVR
jgi:hypothetical protein